MSLLPWQGDLAQRVQTLVTTAKLPHGIVISANEGWGEIEFAQWLALTLLEAPLDLNASEMAHPDLRWVRPDGAQIKVESIREIGQFAYQTSQSGGRKVVVLESAHLLNRNAANALLKTLEEPPEDTFVLLATCHASRLLATVRSRCQRFTIRPDQTSARDWLMRRWNDGDIEQRLNIHGGAPLLVAAELNDGRSMLSDTLNDIVVATEPLAHLDTLLARDPGEVTGGWFRHVKTILAGGAMDAASARHTPSARGLLEFADELLWVRHQLLNTNSANARLLIGRLIVKWHALGT